MTGTTWSKFFWADWESDQALRLCSLAAQGLWMRMLCVAASHDPVGYVCMAGQPLGVTDLAVLAGASETQVAALMSELANRGVFSRDRAGRIYCRRMVRDARRSATNARNGRQGGNPSLRKGEGNPSSDNPPDNRPLKPHKPRARVSVEASTEASNRNRRPEGRAPGVARPPAVKPIPEPEQPTAEIVVLADRAAGAA